MACLLYFRARYYSPQLGQFISRDPLGYVDGMSQYRAYFVPGSVDPWGLCPPEDGCQTERHHWFPQEAAIKTRILKLCPKFNIDFFLTPLLRCSGEKYKKYDAHGWLHHRRDPKWNPHVKNLLDKSKNCCDFLLLMDAAITRAYADLKTNFPDLNEKALPKELRLETKVTQGVWGDQLVWDVFQSAELWRQTVKNCKNDPDRHTDVVGYRFQLPNGSLQPSFSPFDAVAGVAAGLPRVLIRAIGGAIGGSSGSANNSQRLPVEEWFLKKQDKVG